MKARLSEIYIVEWCNQSLRQSDSQRVMSSVKMAFNFVPVYVCMCVDLLKINSPV